MSGDQRRFFSEALKLIKFFACLVSREGLFHLFKDLQKKLCLKASQFGFTLQENLELSPEL